MNAPFTLPCLQKKQQCNELNFPAAGYNEDDALLSQLRWGQQRVLMALVCVMGARKNRPNVCACRAAGSCTTFGK